MINLSRQSTRGLLLNRSAGNGARRFGRRLTSTFDLARSDFGMRIILASYESHVRIARDLLRCGSAASLSEGDPNPEDSIMSRIESL